MTRTLTLSAAIALFGACRKTETVPGYVVIDRVGVAATDLEGGGTSKVTEAWVTVDDRSVGVWELPARIPVVGTGQHRIGIEAGIRRNGDFNDRVRYPYYNSWSTQVELEGGASADLFPEVTYSAADIWLERFNDAGSQLVAGEGSDTTLLLFPASERPDATLDGTQCGGFVLDAARDRIALRTDLDLPGENGPVYLELDFSTDVELTIGLAYFSEGFERSEPYAILVPTASPGSIAWNKVYVDLTGFFNLGGISDRDIYIGAQLPVGRSGAAAYLDNLKLVRPAQ